jgi:hypothetical protein
MGHGMLLRLSRSALAVVADVSAIKRGVSPSYMQRLGLACNRLDLGWLMQSRQVEATAGAGPLDPDVLRAGCSI